MKNESSRRPTHGPQKQRSKKTKCGKTKKKKHIVTNGGRKCRKEAFSSTAEGPSQRLIRSRRLPLLASEEPRTVARAHTHNPTRASWPSQTGRAHGAHTCMRETRRMVIAHNHTHTHRRRLNRGHNKQRPYALLVRNHAASVCVWRSSTGMKRSGHRKTQMFLVLPPHYIFLFLCFLVQCFFFTRREERSLDGA